MTLRDKLIAGYVLFIVALVVLGGLGSIHLFDMGNAAERIISENYTSVVAAQEMTQAVERQETAATLVLLGRRAEANEILAEQRPRFGSALDRAKGNVTETAEPEILAAIEHDEARVASAFEHLAPAAEGTDSEPSSDVLAAVYVGELRPALDALHGNVDRLLEVNQNAMVAKAAEAKALAQTWFHSLLAVSAGLVALAALVARALMRGVFEPIREITDAASRLAEGDVSARALIRYRGEIGELGKQFNHVARYVRKLEQSGASRHRTTG